MNEKKPFVSIMGVKFLNTTKNDFLDCYLLPRLIDNEKTFVVTANPEIVMKTQKDTTYRQAIEAADYIVADGIGIVKAAGWQGEPLAERVAGYDLMVDLLAAAEKKDLRCYFLGAEESVNEKAVAQICVQYPNLQVAGRHHGFFNIADQTIVERIKASQADLVFVALGMPKQELWISQHLAAFEKGVFMGIGGSFDVFAGEVKRAPDFWIKLNLEWAYRLAKQPMRWKRILKVFQFLFLARFKRPKK